MAEFAGAVAGATYELAVERDAHADAVRRIHEDHGPLGRRAPHGPELREDGGLDVVLDDHRQPRGVLKGIAERDVLPAERRRTQEAPLGRVDQTGNRDPNPQALADDRLVGEQLRDARRQHGHHFDGLDGRRQILQREQWMPQQVGDLNERATRADVHGHGAALSRLEEEVLRLAAAFAVALGALEDLMTVEQVLHEPADRAAPHAHQPRQFGTGDRLARANEIQRNLPVDLPRGAAVGDAELRWVDTTHPWLGRAIMVQNEPL